MTQSGKAIITNFTGTHLSRRHLMVAMLGVGAVTAVGVSAQPGQAAGLDQPPTGWSPLDQSRSTNGWPLIARTDDPRISSQHVDGSGQSVVLLAGDVATVLVHVARRFNYEVDTLRAGDFRGWQRAEPTPAPHESNFSSGTAIGLKPAAFPLGAEGGLFPRQLLLVRDIVAQCAGVVTWGGFFGANVHESHFEISVPPSDPGLRALAARMRADREQPGKGPGSGETLPFEKDRLEQAREEAVRQSMRFANS